MVEVDEEGEVGMELDAGILSEDSYVEYVYRVQVPQFTADNKSACNHQFRDVVAIYYIQSLFLCQRSERIHQIPTKILPVLQPNADTQQPAVHRLITHRAPLDQ